MTSATALAGLRVMIVEDDLLIAMLLEDILAEQGCAVVGPFSTVDAALRAAAATALDLAVLDVNLRGERVYPVAEVLAARRVPFLLVTGYGDYALPPGHADWHALTKPFQARQLLKALADRMARA